MHWLLKEGSEQCGRRLRRNRRRLGRRKRKVDRLNRNLHRPGRGRWKETETGEEAGDGSGFGLGSRGDVVRALVNNFDTTFFYDHHQPPPSTSTPFDPRILPMAAVEFQQPEPLSLPLPDISAILPINPDVCGEEEDDDIYRGLPDDQSPPAVITIPLPPPRPESSASSSSSSSSSGYSVSGRLGALAAVVEQAITRWAGRNSSSSSLTSSTSSSSSASRSVLSIQTKSTRKRRRRHSADHNARSERDILARIRVRQETRRIPRGFSLYVPPQLRTSRTNTQTSDPTLQYDEQGILRTHLLPAVLSRVQQALRLSEKLRQPERTVQEVDRIPTIEATNTDGSPSPPMTQNRDHRRTGKGKHREPNRMPREHVPRPIPEGPVNFERGSWPSWWLDISSPTYADMRALGKVQFAFCTTAIPVPTCPLAAPPSPVDPGGYSATGSTRENGTHISGFAPSPFVEHAFRNCSRNLVTTSSYSKPSKVNVLEIG